MTVMVHQFWWVTVSWQQKFLFLFDAESWHRTMTTLRQRQNEELCLLPVWISGNYYSLRSEHEKAIVYFQRALKLNPNYLSAWTLMGHEYTEMKNTSAAIEAYRQAIGKFKEKMKVKQVCAVFHRKLLRYCCFLYLTLSNIIAIEHHWTICCSGWNAKKKIDFS